MKASTIKIKSLRELQNANVKGRVIVLVHLDTCPPCQRFYPLYKDMITQRSGKGLIKFYSLEHSMNPNKQSIKGDELAAIKKRTGNSSVPVAISMENGKYVSHLHPSVYREGESRSATIKELEDFVKRNE
jgi:hypothetical protein